MSRLTVFTRRLFYEKSKKISNNRLCHCDADVYEENETGKLQIADWALIGKNDDFIAYLDQQLLMDTDERVNGVLSSISTASGKEIEIKLPYPLIYMDKEKEIDRNMPYKIAVTKYPSRKYIQFG